MRTPSIQKNFILSTIYQVFLIIVPLVTAPYISRVLGVENIGTYSYMQSILSYFTLFAALGTAVYGKREIAQNREDKERCSQIFWEIELLSVLTTLTVIVFWLLWICFTTQYQLYYMLFSISLISVLFDVSWLYYGLEKIDFMVWINILFRLSGMIALFALVKTKDDLGIYIFINVVMAVLANLSMWLQLPKYVQLAPVRWHNLLVHFRETLVYFIPTIAISIYTVLDKTLIGVITHSASQNGYYEQAVKIIQMAKTVTFVSLNSIMGARLSFLFAKGKTEEIKERIRFSVDYILFMGVGICFGIWAVSDRFVPFFFGEGYDEVILLLNLFCPIVLIIGISNCLGSHYYTPAGLRAKSSRYLIEGAVVNLILNLLLIPKYKSLGAVVASVIAEAIITLRYLINCEGFLKAMDLLKRMWKKLIAGFLMFFVIQLPVFRVHKSASSMLLQVFTGIIVYTMILLIFKDSFAVTGFKRFRELIRRVRRG